MNDNDNALIDERVSFNHENKENIQSKDNKKQILKNKNKYKRKRNYNTMIKENGNSLNNKIIYPKEQLLKNEKSKKLIKVSAHIFLI